MKVMCCNDEEKSRGNCLTDILDTILCLQEKKDSVCDDFGCDKPFLGPSPNFICYNTRPINLYNCCTGELWTFSYTLGATTGTSSTFRVENLDGNCCTCRILAANTSSTASEEPWINTGNFFTINLNCVSAIKCLADTFVSGV